MNKAFIAACGFAVIVAVVAVVFADGTVTTTHYVRGKSVKRTEIVFSAMTNKYASGNVDGIDGEILRVVASPGGSATSNASMTLKDTNSIDILRSSFTTVSNAAVEIYADNGDTTLPVVHDGGRLTFAVTNTTLGSTIVTNGSMTIYWR